MKKFSGNAPSHVADHIEKWRETYPRLLPGKIYQPARISRVKWALQDDNLSARYSANEIFEHEFWENAYFLEICKK